jgi:hypothetical protein
MHSNCLSRSLVACLIVAVGLGYSEGAHGFSEPDTLDWRQYYPLEVGNAWEWYTFIAVNDHKIRRREIVGDTTVGGEKYFVQLSSLFDTDHALSVPELVHRDTVLLRYDEVNKRILARGNSEDLEWHYTCDLSTPFGVMFECDGQEVTVLGGYSPDYPLTIGGSAVTVPARKIHTHIGGGSEFYYGIGELPMIGDGEYGEERFMWVRVGGAEFGASVVSIQGVEGVEPKIANMDVYPNPASDRVRVKLQRPGTEITLEVYDLLGRKVSVSYTCAGQECIIDTSQLSTGQYIIRTRSDSPLRPRSVTIMK